LKERNALLPAGDDIRQREGYGLALRLVEHGSVQKIAFVKYRHLIGHCGVSAAARLLDGNGRVGRLMITLYLISKKLLVKPSLYLSGFFEKNRMLYYDNLTTAREKNALNQWLRFFLVGVVETSKSSIQTFRNILTMQTSIEARTATPGRRQANAKRLVQKLYSRPIVNAKEVAEVLEVSAPTANSLLADLVRLDILEETTGYLRNRMFRFREYLDLF
jgi:cell filamentation protein, protein adenylyltransferase